MANDQKTNFKLYIGIILLIVILEAFTGLLGQLLSDRFKMHFIRFLENQTGILSDKAYLLLFAVILLPIGIVFVIYQHTEVRPLRTKNPIIPTDKERKKYLDFLKKRYRNRYDQKLDQCVPIRLRLIYQSTSPAKKQVEKYFSEIKEQTPVNKKLYKILEVEKQLLIAGERGGGKTTLLLGLVEEILINETGSDALMPIVFDLASWKPQENQTFAQWLALMLNSSYGFSKIYATQAIENNLILPLFDGLDEVGKNSDNPHEIRVACLRAITDYIDEKNITRFVICTQLQTYQTARSHAQIKAIDAQILLSPLSLSQIKTELAKAKVIPHTPFNTKAVKNKYAAEQLLHLLNVHPKLQNVLAIPFYFNIALEVFNQKYAFNQIPNTKAEIEAFLVEAFIQKQLNKTPNQQKFQSKKSRHYLSWLANMMNNSSLVVFELADLQPRLLRSPWLYSWIFGLFYGLLIALFLGLVLDSLSVLIFSITSGLTLIMTIEATSNHLELNPIRTIKWNKFKDEYSWISIFFYVFVGAAGGVYVMESFLGLILGLFVGLVLGVTQAIYVSASYKAIEKPYQRLLDGLLAYLMLWGTILLALLGYYFYLNEPLTFLDYISLGLIGFIVGMLLSLLFITIYYHAIFRICFAYYQRTMPLRAVRFLKYVTTARIMEQDGGGHWRFKHQILQDYLDEPQIKYLRKKKTENLSLNDIWGVGNFYFDKRKHHKAIRYFNQYLDRQPKELKVIYQLGRIYLLKRDLVHAEIYLFQAWEQTKYQKEYAAETAMNLGHIYLLKKNNKIAINWYRKSRAFSESNLDFFWQKMDSSYTDLKMKKQGIRSQAYQDVIQELKNDERE